MKTALAAAVPAFLLLLSQPIASQNAELVDRIVAVVDDDPILESDLDRVIGLGLIERREDESESLFRRRVLDQVIEEKLRFHEIDRFGFSEVSVEDVEHAYEEIRSRFGTETEFQQHLTALGVEPDEIRQLVARQLMVLTYVDERLGPRVFVTSEEIQEYYSETLVPELKARREPVPELAEVRELIREVVKQQRLGEELDRWTEELRREADIEDSSDDLEQSLPDVVLGVDEG